MKSIKFALVYILTVVVCAALVGWLANPVFLGAQPPPALHLTQLSSREWVDLSKLSLVRLPVYTPPPPGCFDCQTRWGADYIIGGVQQAYTEEAEVTLRKMLGAEPK